MSLPIEQQLRELRAKVCTLSQQLVNINTTIISITSNIKPAIIGISGNGGVNDPITGSSIYQNDLLKGFAQSNGYKFYIIVGGAIWQNFGTDSNQFTFDQVTGTINFNGNITWYDGMTIVIDLNQ